jgi:hypothetical protein
MNGDDQNPGAGRGNVTLSTVRPSIENSVWLPAFNNMMTAKT